MTIVKCKICGKEQDIDDFCDETQAELQKYQMCYLCNHWRMNHDLDMNKRGLHNWCVLNGKHYVIGKSDVPKTLKGMCGSKFKLIFNDGVVVETDNLWHQGNISEAHPHWREVMPDNAVFSKESGYEYCS